MTRRAVALVVCAGIAAAWRWPSPLRGQEQPAAPTGTPACPTSSRPRRSAIGPTRPTRMTVPVSIGGQGPVSLRRRHRRRAHRHLARAGAASSISAPAGPRPSTAMTEVSRIATVVIPGLRIGSRTVNDIHAPALARANLGASGMLGVDSLQRQRVVFDFGRQEMTITPSRARARSAGPTGDDRRHRPQPLRPAGAGRRLGRRPAGLGDHRHRLADHGRQHRAAPRARSAAAGSARPRRSS